MCTFLRREEERVSWPDNGASDIVSSYGRAGRWVIVVNGPGAREDRSAYSLVKRSCTAVSEPWHRILPHEYLTYVSSSERGLAPFSSSVSHAVTMRIRRRQVQKGSSLDEAKCQNKGEIFLLFYLLPLSVFVTVCRGASNLGCKFPHVSLPHALIYFHHYGLIYPSYKYLIYVH